MKTTMRKTSMLTMVFMVLFVGSFILSMPVQACPSPPEEPEDIVIPFYDGDVVLTFPGDSVIQELWVVKVGENGGNGENGESIQASDVLPAPIIPPIPPLQTSHHQLVPSLKGQFPFHPLQLPGPAG